MQNTGTVAKRCTSAISWSPDGRVIRLGARGIKWSKADVIRAFLHGRARLGQTVGRLTHPTMIAHDLPGLRDGPVFLSHMNSFRPDGRSNGRVIITDQGHAGCRGDSMDLARQSLDFINGEALGAQLQNVHAAFHKFPADLLDFRRVYIAEIHDPMLSAKLSNMDAADYSFRL